jgi:hypothetical protein
VILPVKNLIEKMQIKLTIGQNEKIDLLIERNWFTGRFTFTANGEKHTLGSPYSLFTHFNVKMKNEYSFDELVKSQNLYLVEIF